MAAHYGFPTGLAGTTQPIGLFEAGGGFAKSDISAYFQSRGLPAPILTVISVDGTGNSPGSDADLEVALDIEALGATYAYMTGKPAYIRIYFSQDFGAAFHKAAADGCVAMSVSWGADESVWGPQGLDALEAAASAAVALGMPIFAASGDDDSNDGGGVTGVDAPASCPHIVGCGGTTLTATAETVWNNNPGRADGEGTGGGYSAHFPAQSWQVGIPRAPMGLGRMVPDLALNADPNTGYPIVVHGQQIIVGGTSAGAPIIAAFFAARGKRGFLTPGFYWRRPTSTKISPGRMGPIASRQSRGRARAWAVQSAVVASARTAEGAWYELVAIRDRAAAPARPLRKAAAIPRMEA